MRGQNSIVCYLSGQLGNTNERCAPGNVASIKVSERIAPRSRYRRLGGEILRDIYIRDVQNVRHQPERAQYVATHKGSHRGACERANTLRSDRSVRGSKIPLWQVAEAVAQRQLTTFPHDLLIEIHLLQQLRTLSVQGVVTYSAHVIHGEVVVAPQTP